MVFWDVGVGLVILWKFGTLCNFTKVGVLFIINRDACLEWRNGINGKSLMEMGPKGWNVNYGNWPNYIV